MSDEQNENTQNELPPESPEVNDAQPQAPAEPRTPNISLDRNSTQILVQQPVVKGHLPLQMPNISAEELIEANERFLDAIQGLQETRSEMVTNKDPQAAEFRAVKIGESDGQDVQAIMTQDEAEAFYRMNAAFELLQRGPMTAALKEDHWSNMPRSKDNNPVVVGQLPEAKNNPSLKLRSAMGYGESRYVPLYTSGFSLQMIQPGTLDELFFNQQLATEQINETRDSTGFSLTARSAYLDQAFSNWVLGYVSKSTCGKTSVAELKSMIAFPDLALLAIGIAGTIYPKGYSLERQCTKRTVVDAESETGYSEVGCGTVTPYLLNIHRMVVARDDRLTENQLVQVSKRTGLIDEKTIHDYRASIRPDVSRIIKVPNTNVELKLRIPTIYQAERVSTAWLNRLQARTRTLNTGTNTRETRELFLQRANSIGRMMMYGAWIESIGIRENAEDAEAQILFERKPVDIKDDALMFDMDKAMDEELENFSSNEETCDYLIGEISKFIAAVTTFVTVVGRTACPKCGAGFNGDDHNELHHDDVISISAFELFFTLLARKIESSGG